ncbi:MAG: hypothetical protein ACLQVN_14305 [Bryobacteraceae bacterium]
MSDFWLELSRVEEAAAARTMGMGDANASHHAAVEATRAAGRNTKLNGIGQH